MGNNRGRPTSSLGDFYADHVHAAQFAAPELHLDRYRARVTRELQRCGIDPASLRGKTVFDVGSGFQALVFHELGCKQIYHADISPKQVAWLRAYCAAHGIDNVHSDCTDVTRDPGRMEDFDLAFVCGVYHHLQQPANLLLNLGARAAAGAHVLIRCYRSGTWSRWLTAHLRELAPRTTPRAITAACEMCYAPEQHDERFIADLRDDLFVPVWGAFHPRQFRHDAATLGWGFWTDESDFDVDFGERDENFRVRFDVNTPATPAVAADTLSSNRAIDQHSLDVTGPLGPGMDKTWRVIKERISGKNVDEVAAQLLNLYRLVRRMRQDNTSGSPLFPPPSARQTVSARAQALREILNGD